MSITLPELQELLEAQDRHVFSDGEDMLIYVMQHEGQLLHVAVSLIEEGGYIRFFIPWFLNLNEAVDQIAVMTKLLEVNYAIKMLKYCCNPADGEIMVEVSLPIEDTEPTETQIARCLYYIGYLAIEERSRLLQLIRTGIYPPNEQAQIDESVRKLLDDSDVESDVASELDGEPEGCEPAGEPNDDADADLDLDAWLANLSVIDDVTGDPKDGRS